jgi:hypothetical protein
VGVRVHLLLLLENLRQVHRKMLVIVLGLFGRLGRWLLGRLRLRL